MSNLKQIGAAVIMYAGQNKGFIPVRYRNYAAALKMGIDKTAFIGSDAGFVTGGGPTSAARALLVINGPMGTAATTFRITTSSSALAT
jgi:hypothetical protein